MKQAVVLEIKGKYAAVLTGDGTVKRIRDRHYRVGDEIRLPENAAGGVSRQLCIAAAAAAAVLLVSGGCWYASETVLADSSVTVSTESGEVELTLNRCGEVIAAVSEDPANRDLVEELAVSGLHRKNLEEMLGMLSETGGIGTVTVTSDNETRKEALEERIEAIIPAEERLPDLRSSEQDGGQRTAGEPETDGEPQADAAALNGNEGNPGKEVPGYGKTGATDPEAVPGRADPETISGVTDPENVPDRAGPETGSGGGIQENAPGQAGMNENTDRGEELPETDGVLSGAVPAGEEPGSIPGGPAPDGTARPGSGTGIPGQ